MSEIFEGFEGGDDAAPPPVDTGVAAGFMLDHVPPDLEAWAQQATRREPSPTIEMEKES